MTSLLNVISIVTVMINHSYSGIFFNTSVFLGINLFTLTGNIQSRVNNFNTITILIPFNSYKRTI